MGNEMVAAPASREITRN